MSEEKKPKKELSKTSGAAKKRVEKQEQKMREAPSDERDEGENRVIAGHNPLWMRKLKPKKDPKEPDVYEQRNIFALNHADFRAFTYDMLAQVYETFNRIEKELGRQAMILNKWMAEKLTSVASEPAIVGTVEHKKIEVPKEGKKEDIKK